MARSLLVASIAWALLAGSSLDAQAVEYENPDWIPTRHAGAPLPDEPLLVPSGWMLSSAVTTPYTLGMGFSYLSSLQPSGWRAGATWGVLGDANKQIGLDFQDYRLHAEVVYPLAPGNGMGPYVAAGLDFVRASGPVKPLGWPLVPHLGFGALGRFGRALGWCVDFSALANGLMVLEGGVLY